TGGMLLQMGSSFSRQNKPDLGRSREPASSPPVNGNRVGRRSPLLHLLPPIRVHPRSSAADSMCSPSGSLGAGTGRIRPGGIGRAARTLWQTELAVEQFLRI